MRKDKRRERDLARQRIVRLLRMADYIYPQEPELAMKYGELARRLALRTRVEIPKEWKWRYCRRCESFLYPGINAEIRVREKRFPHLVIRCEICGSIGRMPYIKEKKLRRVADIG
ncbi:MAG: ribonuclease P [Candidatus Korarchaeota archaeon]|nr:ribonuclease P [Candidatus Korarchaeota archaeon]